MKRALFAALLFIATTARARIDVTIVDGPPYYRDDPIAIKVVCDASMRVQDPPAENARVELANDFPEAQGGRVTRYFQIYAENEGRITVGPFVAMIGGTTPADSAPAVSFRVASEVSASTESDATVLERLKREGRVPLIIRTEVRPAAPMEGQSVDVLWWAIAEGVVPRLNAPDIPIEHVRAGDVVEPLSGIDPKLDRVLAYHARITAAKGGISIPRFAFAGDVLFLDGSSRLVRRLSPPLTIAVTPSTAPPGAVIGEFKIYVDKREDNLVPSAWQPVAIIVRGNAKITSTEGPELLPKGIVYTVRPMLCLLKDGEYFGTWVYDVHVSKPTHTYLTFHYFDPDARKMATTSAALEVGTDRGPAARPSIAAMSGPLPMFIVDAMLGVILFIATAISARRS